jgi:hypothetical protein
VREAASGKVARLAGGFSDSISKLAAHALPEPVLNIPNLRLVCHEGESEDSALLAVFAARGLGVFPVSRLGADDVGLMRGLCSLGSSDGVKEEIRAIRSRRGQHPPLVTQVVAAARP